MPRQKAEKYKIQIQMSLSSETGKLLERVAAEREMSISELAKELIFLGLGSLKYKKEPGVSPLQGIDSSHEGRYGSR